MRYIVTGAAGFIGSNLSARLAKSGHQVVGIDNFSDYYSPSLKELRVAKLLNPAGIRLERIELANVNAIEEVVSDFKPDTIIHLAAQPGVRTPMGKSDQYIQNNLVAFANVLQTAVQANVPDFLYASSSSVYGNSKGASYKEDDNSIKPISIYGATKLANEILAPTFIARSNTRARGMRFFTVYGPWGRPDMAYFRIISSVLSGSEFKKFGGGEVKRDFTFVDDISEAIESLSFELLKHPSGFSDVVNIGGGSPHSLNELIKEISKQLGNEPSVSVSEVNPNDTNYTCADVSLLNNLTSNTPTITLDKGVKETIDWANQEGIKEQLDFWVNSTN